MNKKEIFEKIQNAEIVNAFIGTAELGKDASFYMSERNTLGNPAIIFDCGKEKIDNETVISLSRSIKNMFEDELEICGMNLITRTGCPAKIEFEYRVINEVKYDFSKAKDYLENVCPPELVANYCNNALERLWKIHSFLDIQNNALTIEDFKGVSAALSLCKDIADMVDISD